MDVEEMKIKKQKLKDLADEHDCLCDNFDEKLHELYDSAQTICKEFGLTAARISKFEKGRQVTRLEYFDHDNQAEPIDEEWFKRLWKEDDQTLR